MNSIFLRFSAAVTLISVLGACASSRSASSSAANTAAHAAHNAHAGHGATAEAAAATDHSAHAAHGGGHGGHQMDLGDIPAPVIPQGSLITAADVMFMQGMIGHHAQAVHMTRIARNAGASERLLRLALKIDLSQAGEIALMQDWLRAYNQYVPDTASWRKMSMTGLLTPEEMAELEAARGTDFDRLFLTRMITHHEGAIIMVKDLFASPRAGQEVDISVLANDVEVTQLAEIALMRQMLLDM